MPEHCGHGWRMVVTDLDGTVLRPDGTCSARTKAILTALRDAGVHTVAATARPPRERAFVAGLGIPFSYLILANGAYVLESTSGSVLRAKPLHPARLDHVITRLRARYPGVVFTAETAEDMLSEPGFAPYGVGAEGPWTPRLAASVAGTAYKLLCRHPDLRPDRIAEAAGCLVGEDLTVTCSAPTGLMEVMAGEADKGQALRDLCELVDIPRSQVVGFGDMVNDVPMLRQCGLSVAMGNACREVVAAADLVADDCERDGVAAMLERLCGDQLRRTNDGWPGPAVRPAARGR